MVEDDEQRRKNILAYFQGLTAFNRLQEAVELNARLAEIQTALTRLEAQRAQSKNGSHLFPV